MMIGVDIGGTFTDFVAAVDGGVQIYKVLSTPANPAEAMLAGLGKLSDGDLSAITHVVHGSTVATNAILERKGAPTALITTRGFRDILSIGRQNRPVLYALQPRLPPPLIPRRWCYEAHERLDHTGKILVPLDLCALDAVLDEIARQGIQSVAICLLYSYVNPAHEHAVRARILERGLLSWNQIALSCEVLPEFREYERASTVALEAYVRPVMGRYLERIEMELPESCALRVMQSDGGVTSSQRARQQVVRTVLSGPAAGVIGGFQVAQMAGYDQVITLDMGGTSTDVALCPGRLSRRPESEIDKLPLRTRLLDIETIGAGGGSIARVDVGGVLQVGPDSAGADPGPICYGRGGHEITVTDANVLLGRLDADHFLGGSMSLSPEPARSALSSLAERMSLGAEAVALGVIDVTNVNIDRALRRVSVARGHDPRTFTLVAFGGAGPLHACEVAERLGIPRVLVPRYPGVLCALGLLMADVVLESSQSVLRSVVEGVECWLEEQLRAMIVRARADLLREGVNEEDMVFTSLVDARYLGQGHELTVPFSGAGSLLPTFHAAHAQAYGHTMPGTKVEVVNLRLQSTGLAEKPALPSEPVVRNDGSDALVGEASLVARHRGQKGDPTRGVDRDRTADFSFSRVALALYDRPRLRPGAAFAGPALVFQMDSTVYVAPSWSAQVDGSRNIVLEYAP